MSEQRDPSVTHILQAIRAGDASAAQRLLPLVYEELRRVAGAAMARQRPGHTLQATALVHEAYLRLMGKEETSWENRRHFFFAAARAMHDILVEQARRRASLKRGGDMKRVDTLDLVVAAEAPSEDILALDEVLQRLRQEDERKYRIVELRFFAGLTAAEAAAALDTPLRTFEREWAYIKARLHKDLSSTGGAEPG